MFNKNFNSNDCKDFEEYYLEMDELIHEEKNGKKVCRWKTLKYNPRHDIEYLRNVELYPCDSWDCYHDYSPHTENDEYSFKDVENAYKDLENLVNEIKKYLVIPSKLSDDIVDFLEDSIFTFINPINEEISYDEQIELYDNAYYELKRYFDDQKYALEAQVDYYEYMKSQKTDDK